MRHLIESEIFESKYAAPDSSEKGNLTKENKKRDLSRALISTNIGKIPLEDFLDITAIQNGFASYADLRKSGYNLDYPEDALEYPNDETES